jgi:peptidoglycan/LPS O-acetylase OafA/YrhL
VSETARTRGSVSLDGLRAISSLAVFLGHSRAMLFQDADQMAHPGLLGWAILLSTRFGHAAVIIFFAASGYLVGGSALRSWTRGDFHAGQYAATRLTRLWLPMIPALLIGALLDRIGLLQFGSHPIYAGGQEWSSIILRPVAEGTGPATWFGNLAFVQTILVPPAGSNGPLWSMANEFWYYVLFPLALISASKKHWAVKAASILAIALICVFVGVPILLKLPLWLFGAFAAALPRREIKSAKTLAWIAGGLMILFGLAPTVIHKLGLSEAIGTAIDYPTGLTAAALIYLVMLDRAPAPNHWFNRAKSGIANLSFSLYLLHMPILALAGAAILSSGTRWTPTLPHAAAWLGLSAAIVVVAYGHSLLFERPVKAVRERVMRAFRIAKPLPASAEA